MADGWASGARYRVNAASSRCKSVVSRLHRKPAPKNTGTNSHSRPSRGICTEIRRRMGVARTPTASSQNAAANPAAGRRTLNTPSTHSGTAMGFSSVALLLNRRSSCPTAKRSSAVTPKYTAAASAVRFAA